jgi:ribosomal protein S18 acetylase RimI-like enzyme
MKVTLRPATPADTPVMLAVYASTRSDELKLTDWDDTRKQEFIRQQFEAQDAYYRANYVNASYDLIVVDGKPAGRLFAARWPDEIRIMDIALLPAFQRRGAGSRLLRKLQTEAGASGLALRIHVERFNPALALYAKLGFRMVEDRGVYLFLEWTSPAVNEPSAGAGVQENTAS